MVHEVTQMPPLVSAVSTTYPVAPACGLQVTVTVPTLDPVPGVATTLVTEPGTASGVTGEEAAEFSPGPYEVTARTRTT